MGKFTIFAYTDGKFTRIADTGEKTYKICGYGFNGKTLIPAPEIFVYVFNI